MGRPEVLPSIHPGVVSHPIPNRKFDSPPSKDPTRLTYPIQQSSYKPRQDHDAVRLSLNVKEIQFGGEGRVLSRRLLADGFYVVRAPSATSLTPLYTERQLSASNMAWTYSDIRNPKSFSVLDEDREISQPATTEHLT